jgi:hypothetical protein
LFWESNTTSDRTLCIWVDFLDSVRSVEGNYETQRLTFSELYHYPCFHVLKIISKLVSAKQSK